MKAKYHLINYQDVRLYVLDEFKFGGKEHLLCLDFRPTTDSSAKYCMALLRKGGLIRKVYEHIDFDLKNIAVIRSRLRDTSIFSAMDAMQGLERHSINPEEHRILAEFITDLRAGNIL